MIKFNKNMLAVMLRKKYRKFDAPTLDSRSKPNESGTEFGCHDPMIMGANMSQSNRMCQKTDESYIQTYTNMYTYNKFLFTDKKMSTKVVLQKSGSGKHNSRTSSHHMPRLDTIEMVEKIISDKKEFSSKNKLWRDLPKQMQYTTLLTILNYLEKSNKIMYDKKGAILWIFADNPKLKKIWKESIPL